MQCRFDLGSFQKLCHLSGDRQCRWSFEAYLGSLSLLCRPYPVELR